MMMKFVTLLAVATLGSTDAYLAAKTEKPSNNTMSVGDGTTVKTNGTTTIFLGTEYNPTKCVLQFQSLKCNDDDCGELNSYPLECVSVGRDKGKDKKVCQCKAADADKCQNSTLVTPAGVPQFGDCSNNPCMDSYGHVPSKLELRICAEKLHCVKEVNTTASVPAQICHTCRSCIAQNDANNAKLKDKRRFDCRKICPKEILESLEKRNKNGLGIADEFSSDSGSAEEEEGSEGSEAADSTGSVTGSKAAGSKSAASVPVVAMVSSIVVAALSVVLL